MDVMYYDNNKLLESSKDTSVDLAARTRAHECLFNFNFQIELLKGKNIERYEIIDRVFQHAEEDLEIHVESIKNQLDLQIELIDKCIDTVNMSLRKRLVRKKGRRALENSMDEFTGLSHEIVASRIESLVYTCCVDLPTQPMLGYFNSLFIDLEKLKEAEPKKVNLNELYVTSMCEISDDSIIVTACERNSVFLMNKEFEIVNEITKIDKIMLNLPFLVCKGKENLYICDNQNRCIVTNRQLNKIKKIFSGENANCFKEMCYYNNRLYILYANERSMEEYDSNGEFLNKITLNVPTEFDGLAFETFQISQEGIFTFFFGTNTILNFTMDGDLKTSVKNLINNMLMSLCLVDNYLFLLNDNGNIICYEIIRHEPYFKQIFERKLTSNCMAFRLFFTQNSMICYFKWSKTINYNPHVFIVTHS